MNKRLKTVASLVLTVLMLASMTPITVGARADYYAKPSWSPSAGNDYIQVRLYEPKTDNDFEGRFEYYGVELTGSGYDKIYFADWSEYVTFNNLKSGTEYYLKITAYYKDPSGKDVLKTDSEYIRTTGNGYYDYNNYYSYGNRNVISQPSPFTMGNAVFVINGNYDRLNGVTLNGYSLKYGTDYLYEYVDNGRLRVTILSTALTWLSNGYHSALFTLADGYTASTSFQVSRGTSASTPTPAPTPTIALNYTVTASSLRVREYASASARQISSLVRGTAVGVAEISNGWGRITLYDGRSGWVSMQHLTSYGSTSGSVSPSVPSIPNYNNVVIAEPATNSGSTAVYGIYYTTISLRMRSGPSSSNDIIGVLPAGTAVYVSVVDGSWAHCIVNGQTVYVDVNYLRR